MPDELYWRSTPHELSRLIEALGKREERAEENAVLRAGLTASAVYNVHRKKGKRAIRPQDFLRKKATRRLTADDMRQWMKSVNAANAAKKGKRGRKKKPANGEEEGAK